MLNDDLLETFFKSIHFSWSEPFAVVFCSRSIRKSTFQPGSLSLEKRKMCAQEAERESHFPSSSLVLLKKAGWLRGATSIRHTFDKSLEMVQNVSLLE